MACSVGCGNRDPATEEIRHMEADPEWCPATFEEGSAAMFLLECEHGLACYPDAYPSLSACVDIISSDYQPTFNCFHGCELRKCMQWYHDNTNGCDDDNNVPPTPACDDLGHFPCDP
jgi:hypothetical protein